MNMGDLMIGLVLFGFFGFLIYMTGMNKSLTYCDKYECHCCTTVDESEIPVQYENESTASTEVEYEDEPTTSGEVEYTQPTNTDTDEEV